jgi:cytochrome c oxidase assembly protein subunit 15
MNTSAKTDRPKDGPAIRAWLYFLCSMIFAMILVGGATRLTDSGLSITEWQPIIGIVPPLNDEAWHEAFEKYREIPEYKTINKGMELAEFKFIYWWEWGHRFLGRMIGFVFLLPFLYFLTRKQISRRLMPRLIFMFVLGGLQGALGWYMVKSGLVDRVDVSQYRLAAHLCAAVLIFGYIFWVATRLRRFSDEKSTAPLGITKISAAALTVAIFIQIALGAFVAGLDAGQGYNTWPLIHGVLIPEGLGVMTPWYLNLFENALTVQFDHRIAAYALILWAFLHGVLVFGRSGSAAIRVSATAMVLAVWGQAALGIVTLLAKVPIWLGLAHQGMAIIVFALALVHLSRLLPAPDPGPR